MKSALPAPTGKMLMAVDKTRNRQHICCIKDFDNSGEPTGFDMFLNGENTLPAKKDIASAQSLWRKHFSIT